MNMLIYNILIVGIAFVIDLINGHLEIIIIIIKNNVNNNKNLFVQVDFMLY